MKSNNLVRICLVALLGLVITSTLMNEGEARGGNYVIQPGREMIETVELGMAVNVSGRLLVHNGAVDFYATSPTNEVLFLFNDTSDLRFKFSKAGDGNHRMHIVNSHEDASVSVTLEYGLEFLVATSITLTIDAGATAILEGTRTVKPAIDVYRILQVISMLVTIIAGLLSIFGTNLYIKRKKKPSYIQGL